MSTVPLLGNCLNRILRTKITDVLIVLSALVPALLLLAGRPALALMSIIPLLIGACLLCAYYEQRDHKP